MRNILFLFLFCFITISSYAQQDQYGWRLGAYGGVMTYYGDLSYKLVDPNDRLSHLFDDSGLISYGASIEKSLSKTWGLRLMGMKGSFIANDRSVDWDGNLRTNNSNFARSLNAKTDIVDWSLQFVVHLDNEKVLSKKAFIAPYFTFGLGITSFEVFGDQYFSDGKRYYYWQDQTIRDLAENDPNASNALIIEQDGVFETNLSEAKTEGFKYRNNTISVPLGLGFKFRLSDRFNLNLESVARFTSTDYLDDVGGKFPDSYDNETQQYLSNPSNISGEYRGDKNGNDDLYFFTSVSLHYNFGRKKAAFNGPVIYTGNNFGLSETLMPQPDLNTKMADELVTTEDSLIKAPSSEIVFKDTMTFDSIYTTISYKNVQLVDSTAILVQIDSNSYVLLESIAQMKTLRDSITGEEVVVLVVRMDALGNELSVDTITYPLQELKIDSDSTGLAMDSLTTMITSQAALDSVVFVTDSTVLVVDTIVTRIQTKVEKTPIPVTVVNPSDSIFITDSPDLEQIPATEELSDSLKINALEAEIANLRSNQSGLKEEIKTEVDSTLKALDSQLAQIKLQAATKQRDTTVMEAPVNMEERENLQKISTELDDIKSLIKEQNQSATADPRDAEIDDLKKQLAAIQASIAEKEKTIVQVPVQAPPKGVTPEEVRLNNEVNQLKLQLAILQQPKSNTTPAQSISKDTSYTALKNELADLRAELKRKDNSEIQTQLMMQMLLQMQAQNAEKVEKPAVSEESKALQEQITALNKQLSDQKKAEEASVFEKEIASMKVQMERLQNELEQSKKSKVIIQAPPAVKKEPSENEKLQALINGKDNYIVFFATGSSAVDNASKAKLVEAVNLLKTNPKLEAVLEGFTDASGNPQSNLLLSQKRSNAVKNYLISQGVPAAQVTAAFQGVDKTSTDPAFGRRVEVKLYARK